MSAPFITTPFSALAGAGATPILAATPVQTAGFGYGFMIHRDPRNPGPWPFNVELFGQGGGKSELWVSKEDFYVGAFDVLKIRTPFNTPPGDWFLTIALEKNAFIRPVSPMLTAADFPVSSGGLGGAFQLAASTARFAEDVDAANTPADFPAAPTDGMAIGNASVFDVFVKGEHNGAGVVLSGAVDIWRYNSYALAWSPVLLNVPLNVPPGGGGGSASFPASDFGVRIPAPGFGFPAGGDRWLALPNGVVLDDAGAQVDVYMRVQ